MSDRSMPQLPADAALSSDHRLLVPMRLQALAITDPDPESVPWQWVDLTPKYIELYAEQPRLGRQLRPDLFTNLVRGRPGAGIHLHWSLPDAFTHVYQEYPTTPGQQKDAPPMVFRPVPNRWLVVRLWEKPEDTLEKALKYKAWVVESDYLGPEGTNNWLTLDPSQREFRIDDKHKLGTKREFRIDDKHKLGTKRDLNGYASRQNNLPLTAVAPGNLAFSSFYPSCRNVFGFHDLASDLEHATYTYVVVGWFAEPGKDPLFDCKGSESPRTTPKDDWIARMGKLGWSVPADTKELPTRTLCQGTIHSVNWPPQPGDFVATAPEECRVAVGNSVLEAVAALVDENTKGETDNRSRLLEELQVAILQDRPPSADELFSGKVQNRRRLTPLRARLHEKMFTALPGGSRWEIDQPQADPRQVTNRSTNIPNLPHGLAEKLQQINSDQRKYDADQRRLIDLQRNLYAQWHKRRWLQLGLSPDQATPEHMGKLDQRIGDLTKDHIEPLRTSDHIKPLRTSIGKLQDSINQNKTNIDEGLRGIPPLTNHKLVKRPMPRYWCANDPTLVMSGVPIPAMQDGASPLTCRVTGQTISAIVCDTRGYGSVDIRVTHLKERIAITTRLPAEIRGDFVALLSEALFLDPQRATWLAQIDFATRAGGTDRLAQRVRDVARILSAIQAPDQGKPSSSYFSIGIPGTTTGSAPAAFESALSATNDWRRPGWTPVFMAWSADYYPSRGGAALDSLDRWRFDGSNVDYTPIPDRPESGGPDDYCHYDGYAPLSDTIGRGLSKEKGAFPWPTKYPEDGFIFDDSVGWKSLVAQSMGGLTEALIMLDAAIQVPPLKGDSLKIDDDILKLLDGQYARAPLPTAGKISGFFPIRDGHLDIGRVWLVDTFGRANKVIEATRGEPAKNVYVSRSLAVPGNPSRLRLSPRLAQPSRLLFRWLSANDDKQEFLGDRATQPVCGWIIPNRLDNSLLIEDDKGQALGAVQSIIQEGGWDNKGIRWSKLPIAAVGPASPQARPSETDIKNEHLRGFVNGLLDLAKGPDMRRTGAFQNLVRLITETTERNPHAPEYQDLSVLVGQPLALVRASLRLDLLGPPAADQSWSQLDQSSSQSAAPGFTQVPFQVWLGDRRKGPDGLIGYFRSGEYGSLYLAQDLEPGRDGDDEVYFPRPEKRALPVTADPMAQTVLTLLLDPRLGVHINSGMLPTKVIDLPPALVSAALATLDAPFLVAPILGEQQRGLPNIPLSTDLPGEWTWTRLGTQPTKLEAERAATRSLFGKMAFYEGWLSLTRKSTEG